MRGQFALGASLDDLLAPRPRLHDTANSPPREDDSSSLPELKAALQRATAWLDGSLAPPDSRAAVTTLVTPPPHTDLARVAAALAAARSSPDAAQVLASACQALTASTLQLARAASATAARESSSDVVMPADAEPLKAQLFWACHLTTALHTFISTSQAAPAPATAAAAAAPTKRQAAARRAAAPPPAPTPSMPVPAAAACPPAHHLSSKLQERWQQAELPGILQHLHTCYQHLLQPTEATAAALTTKERAAADKLLHGVCMHLLSSTTAGSSKPRKPPAKQPRKATTSCASNTLSEAARQQCAVLLGCHLLFSHAQQLQQQAQQPGGAQAGQRSGWRWCAEACRMLGDASNVCLQQAVPAAFTSLLSAPSTRAAACQMLCAAAAAAFPGACSTDQQQQQRGRATSKQPPDAAAGSSGLLLLELVSAVLAAPWSWPEGSNNSSAQKQLLAAAVLPVLQPAASRTNPPAARKHVLSIAAAAGAVPARAGECGRAAAAAAAAWAALAAAAQGEKDAHLRAKALALLAELAPTMLRQWGSWHVQAGAEQQQQEGQDATAAAATNPQDTPSAAAAAAELQGAAGSMAAVLAAVQEQLLGSSKSCRLKALQLLQQLLVRLPGQSRAGTTVIAQLQQRCAVAAFPGVCSVLAAGQDSRLHCPNCKAAAEVVLQAMAAVLPLQQALQLALSCDADSSDDDSVSPAGRLLVALSGCSGQQLHALLRQQLAVAELPAQRQHLVRQLQPLVTKQQGLEGLRRHAFAVVCQALMAAADAQQVTDTAAEEQGGTAEGCQRELLLAVQLLQIAGGCHVGSGGSDGDLRGELGILADALDLCCTWLQQALDAEEAQHNQLPPSSGFALCHEVLGSLLAVLDAAAEGTGEGSAAAGEPAPLQRRSHEWLWGSIGSCCMHHLGLITRLASRSDGPVRLPLDALDAFLRVLCHANRGQQVLLHDLLRGWHSRLAAPGAGGPLAEPAVEQTTVQLEGFLLLVKHLGGLYATVRAEAARALGCSSAAARSREQQPGPEEQQPDQQQPAFDYMQKAEEASAVEGATARLTDTLLAETAPACYAPLLLQLTQAAAAPVHIRVLALQALQPLLLVSAAFSQKHSGAVASILSAAATAPPPAPLLVQAVATAGALVEARPSQSAELVALLEHVLLSATVAAAADAATVDGGGGTSATAAAACQAGTAAAAVTAAGCYCRLLLGAKLLLTGRSWGVVAAGLLASGQLQGVASAMRQLVVSLVTQRHVPRPAAALGLLLNLDLTEPQPPSADARRPDNAAQQLVEQLLGWVLRPEDLASEALCMPLLQSLTMGLSSLSSSSSGALAATARLLAACTLTGRCQQACLEGLLRTCQAHRHSLARSCPHDVLDRLTAFATTGTGKAAASAARSSRAAAAAAAAAEGDGAAAAAAPAASTAAAATQAKLLALLQSIGAAGSRRRVDDAQAAGGSEGGGTDSSGGEGEEEEEDTAAPPAVQQLPAGAQQQAAAAASLKKKRRARAMSGQPEDQQAREELQALLLARQRDVQVLRGAGAK